MTSARLFRGLAALIAVSILMLNFQNCSPQFQVAEDVASQTALDSSVLSAPEIMFSNPSSLYATPNVSLNFSVLVTGQQTTSSVQCQLNNGALSDCRSGSVTYSNLADGNYTVRVVAQSSSGLQNERSHQFQKDSTAPVVVVSMMPALITNQTTANFVFSSNDMLSGVQSTECSLNNAAFSICASPMNLANLQAGAQNFRIRSTDRAGNVSAIYSHSWTLDLGVPSISITSMPSPLTNSTNASFSFSGSGVVAYECSFDSAAYTPCSSPQAYSNLLAGSHTFRVRGSNAAGNLAMPAQFVWSIDNVAPGVPSLTPTVSGTSNSRSNSISFSSTDPNGVTFQCSTDNGAFANCTSPSSLSNLADGAHSFRVRATDGAGNTSGIATHSWSVDATPPVLAFSSTPSATTTMTSASFVFTSTDSGSGINLLQCSLDNAAFSACVSPLMLSNLSVGAHNLRVQARDAATNTQLITFSWTINAVTPPPVDPPPVVGEGPNRVPVFVAQGRGARTIMSCDGGQTWIRDRTDFPGLNCDQTDCLHHAGAATGLAYDRGYFYASYGWGASRSIKRSTDGYNWTVIGSKPGAGAGGGLGVFTNGLLWVNGSEFDLSTNMGQNWTAISSRVGYILSRNVTSSGNMGVVTGDDANTGKVTYDGGQTWGDFSIPGVNLSGRNFQLIRGNGVLVGLATYSTYSQQTGGFNAAYTSVSRDGGRTWSSRQVYTSPEYFVWSQAIFDGTQFIAFLGTQMWSSSDGETWRQAATNITHNSAAARSPSGVFVAIPEVFGTQYAYRSTNGTTWTRLSSAAFPSGIAILRIVSGYVDASVCQ